VLSEFFVQVMSPGRRRDGRMLYCLRRDEINDSIDCPGSADSIHP